MSLHLDPNAICAACGHFGAYRFETETLCAECYANRGSCCSGEFSGRPPECEKAPSASATEPNRNAATEVPEKRSGSG
jgi:hypothetical protein